MLTVLVVIFSGMLVSWIQDRDYVKRDKEAEEYDRQLAEKEEE